MKILFAGGGTGGHFYPIIAVARSLRRIAEEEKIVDLKFFMMGDKVIDVDTLAREDIKFIKIPAGKMRRYFSFRYLVDSIKIFIGIIKSFWRLYLLMPDVIFSNGGFASFPPLFAAKFLGIPVIIHSADLVPGTVNRWSGKWSQRIAVSFPESLKFFESKNAALTGNPIRAQLVGGNLQEALESFKLEENLPTLLVLGGSQGAEIINNVILSMLHDVLVKYQIIHQTGQNNLAEITARVSVSLEHNELKSRYHPYGFISEGELRNASRVASIAVARAGANTIFEIAAWGLPAILVPLKNSAQDHQRENAYAYARAGACEVIEETNLKPHLLLEEINKILSDKVKLEHMKTSAHAFAKPDAADQIAREIIKLGIHE